MSVTSSDHIEFEKLPPKYRKIRGLSPRDDSLESSRSHYSTTESGRSSPIPSSSAGITRISHDNTNFSSANTKRPKKRTHSHSESKESMKIAPGPGGGTLKLNAFSTPEDVEDFLRSTPPQSDFVDSEIDTKSNGSTSAPESTSNMGLKTPRVKEEIHDLPEATLVNFAANNEISVKHQESQSDVDMATTTAGPSNVSSNVLEQPLQIHSQSKLETSEDATRLAVADVKSDASAQTPNSTKARTPELPPSILKHKYPPKLYTESLPSTRSNSPSLRAGSRSPSKWASVIPAGSRRSSRRIEVRPWGPKHLEYDYSVARREFQAAAYDALGKCGYVPPKGFSKTVVSKLDSLPSMEDLKEIKVFRRACERLDEADRMLEEALERGETWENTPVPAEYLNLGLDMDLGLGGEGEELKSSKIENGLESINDTSLENNVKLRRVPRRVKDLQTSGDGETKRKRSRSSVTLEEEAGSISIGAENAPTPKRRGRPPKKKP